MKHETTVAIVGAGVAGLTLATFLRESGIPCILLERRARAYVSERQRAGVVEARGVRMFERWGLDRLLAGPVAQTIDYRINGMSRIYEITGDAQGRFCTQQMLVNNLLKEPLDIRFEVTVTGILNEESPAIRYADADGEHELACRWIVGCDAAHGPCRQSIPDGVITIYTHEFGIAWLAALVEAPVTGHPIMGVSDHGFVAQLPRGPQRSRYYLQCALGDGPADWPDTRLWEQVRLRMGDPTIANAKVHDRLFVPLRSVVHAPMQYRRLYLAGDAAHLVPPTGAKGMNLALYDVDVLAQAFRDRDQAALDRYTETVLPRVWKYQEFSAWMTDTMHDAGDPTLHGPFRQQTARARLDTLFSSPTAGQLHGEFQRGLI